MPSLEPSSSRDSDISRPLGPGKESSTSTISAGPLSACGVPAVAKSTLVDVPTLTLTLRPPSPLRVTVYSPTGSCEMR